MKVRGGLEALLERYGFIVARAYRVGDEIVVDFYDPLLGDDLYLRSSLAYNPNTGRLEVTARIALRGYKELYMDYCIEDCELVCRPHFYIEDGKPILSMHAVFHTNPLERLKALLNEVSPRSSA